MNYTTPDIEIKKVFAQLENAAGLKEFRIRDFCLYGICRFYLEMCYRSRYLTEVNKYNAFKNEGQDTNSQVRTSLLDKVKNKIAFIKEKKTKEKYQLQFDDLSTSREKYSELFVATSGFRDANDQSIELIDLIDHKKAKGMKIAFVLPNYNTNIKRRKQYDLFLSFDLKKKVELSIYEKQTIEKFVLFIAENLPLLDKSSLDGIYSQIHFAVSASEQLEKTIRHLNVKLVTARSLYSDKWVVMACRKAGAKVLEVQHGVFTEDNFYYHSLGALNFDELLIPDHIACLGNEWLKILRDQDSHWNEKNSGLLGSNFRIPARKKGVTKKVLIAFQDFDLAFLDIRNEILDLFKKYTSQLAEYEFTLRIHPANTSGGLGIIPSTLRIRYSDPKKETAAEALSNCDVLICATSMMLYEALAFSIPVISFERFRKMTRNKGVHFASDADQLMNELKLATNSKADPIEYLNESDFQFTDSIQQSFSSN